MFELGSATDSTQHSPQTPVLLLTSRYQLKVLLGHFISTEIHSELSFHLQNKAESRVNPGVNSSRSSDIGKDLLNVNPALVSCISEH